MAKVIIDFATEEVAMHFALWLCGAGEQYYWQWMEAREQQQLKKKDITATRFYYNKFEQDGGGDLFIDTVLGSVLRDEEE